MISSRKRQSGLSLLEVLLAVSIIIFLGSLQLTRIKNETESMQSNIVGEHLATVGGAFNSYLTIHFNNITQNISVTAPGTADDPGPRRCEQPAADLIYCEISTDTLRRNGLLPNSFSGRNAYGSSYRYVIKVSGTSPNWQVDGVVFTDQPYTTGGSPRFDLIGQAMLAAGSDSGTTRTQPNVVVGLNGAWMEDEYGAAQVPSGVNGIDTVGLLAYRAGYGTSGYMSFLRRDGSTPMTGNLQMDENDIVAAGDITSTGMFTNEEGIRITQPSTEAIILGSSDVDVRTIIGNSGDGLRVINEGGVYFQNEAGVATPLLAGDARLAGLEVSHDALVEGNFEATAINVIDTIHAGSTITSLADIEAELLISNGDIRAQNTIFSSEVVLESSSGSGVGSRLTSTQWLMESGIGFVHQDSSTMRFTGPNLRADGNIIADGNVQVGQYLNFESTHGIGSSGCAHGAVSQAPDGSVISCIGGTWQTAGFNDVVQTTGTAAGGTSQSIASCNTAGGYTLAGGGYALVTRPGSGHVDNINTNPFSPAISIPDAANNRWIVQPNNTGEAHGSTFRAYALCAR